MRILRELNAAYHTIILVTHDMQVAKNATRIIEISDGEIISDRPNVPDQSLEEVKSDPDAAPALQNKQKKAKVFRLGDQP